MLFTPESGEDEVDDVFELGAWDLCGRRVVGWKRPLVMRRGRGGGGRRPLSVLSGKMNLWSTTN